VDFQADSGLSGPGLEAGKLAVGFSCLGGSRQRHGRPPPAGRRPQSTAEHRHQLRTEPAQMHKFWALHRTDNEIPPTHIMTACFHDLCSVMADRMTTCMHLTRSWA
jgi:hypothetical protein